MICSGFATNHCRDMVVKRESSSLCLFGIVEWLDRSERFDSIFHGGAIHGVHSGWLSRRRVRLSH
jgi:hypothetical protein